MGIRNRRARDKAKTHIIGFGIAGVAGFLVLAVVALAYSLGAVVDSWLQDLPDFQSADAYLVSEPTQVFSSDGTLMAEFYTENRRAVDMSEISPYVINGTVDTEDIRFYQHNGVDPQGILRAVVVQVMGGSEGASTITQQLVRNTVLSDEQFDLTLRRKVREAYIAIEMEKKYTKEQVLNMYLNTINYGHGAYGIEAASITYFNKSAKDLTLAEAALLVGLPNSPSYYDPFENPDAALHRRNSVVLQRMLDAGDITQEEFDEAYNTPLELNPGSSVMEATGAYPYWTNYIRDLLSADFSADTVMMGGLRVYTTLDPTLQGQAEAAVQAQLDAIGDGELNAAMAVVDPSTGYLKAMVGGRDFESNQFNCATQARRQPGSSFKAFTLTAAVTDGMNPDIYLDCNSPIQISSAWKVQNMGNAQYGTITLARATELSSNTGYAQVAEAIGADRIVEAAHKMGISVDLPSYPSITLGTVGVPPIQMAGAYATLASGGVHRDVVAITKIEDRNGNTVYEHTDNPTQAVEPSVAWAVTQVLEGVITRGTAKDTTVGMSANQPVAGKTGTTEGARDLWFCGYTPQYAAAVWVGYPAERTIYVGYDEGHPWNTACPIFFRFMNMALEGTPRQEFPTAAAPDYKPNSTWSFSKAHGSENPNSTAEGKPTNSETTTTPSTPGTITPSEEPTTPETPTNPETPTTPEEPNTPETPPTPEEPDTPETPPTPEEPVTPDPSTAPTE